jgi:ABC-type sugar transport system, permease component
MRIHKIRRIFATALCCTFVAALAAAMLIPVIMTCTRSFESGIAGYADFYLWKPLYLKAFMNSVITAGSAAVLSVAVSIPAAYVFAKVKFKGSSALFYVYIIVMMMPFQVTLLPQYMVSKAANTYDTFLAVIIPAVFSPFAVFLITQMMKTIPNEYIEAARLDTGSTLRILWHIIIPVMRTGILCTFVLVFTENWNMVDQPLVLMETFARYPLTVLIARLAATADAGTMAASVVIMIPPLLLYLFFKDEVTEGLAAYRLN